MRFNLLLNGSFICLITMSPHKDNAWVLQESTAAVTPRQMGINGCHPLMEEIQGAHFNIIGFLLPSSDCFQHFLFVLQILGGIEEEQEHGPRSEGRWQHI